jgi:hypothetical protein
MNDTRASVAFIGLGQMGAHIAGPHPRRRPSAACVQSHPRQGRGPYGARRDLA